MEFLEQDIYDFLKENGFSWSGNSTLAKGSIYGFKFIDNVQAFKDIEPKEFEKFFSSPGLFLSDLRKGEIDKRPFNHKYNHKCCITATNFIIAKKINEKKVDENDLKSAPCIDLSKKWRRFLMARYEDYYDLINEYLNKREDYLKHLKEKRIIEYLTQAKRLEAQKNYALSMCDGELESLTLRRQEANDMKKECGQ